MCFDTVCLPQLKYCFSVYTLVRGSCSETAINFKSLSWSILRIESVVSTCDTKLQFNDITSAMSYISNQRLKRFQRNHAECKSCTKRWKWILTCSNKIAMANVLFKFYLSRLAKRKHVVRNMLTFLNATTDVGTWSGQLDYIITTPHTSAIKAYIATTNERACHRNLLPLFCNWTLRYFVVYFRSECIRLAFYCGNIPINPKHRASYFFHRSPKWRQTYTITFV